MSYLLALGLGGVGMYQTMTEDPLTVHGRQIHALAAGGILVWVLGSSGVQVYSWRW